MSLPASITSASIIGAGNLAWHLAQELHKNGINILQIYSPTPTHATALAALTNAEAITEVQQLAPDADICFICVKDDVIPAVINDFPFTHKPAVHTSGSQPLSIFPESFTQCGVWYPLQSFRKERPIEWKGLPVCLEARNAELLQQLEALAEKITGRAHRMTSEQRAWAHLSAVIVSNFTNALYDQAQQLMQAHAMDWTVLHPLITETALRMNDMLPQQAQTGPARRDDKAIMQRHIEMLAAYPELQKLYVEMSALISKNLRVASDE